MSWFRSHHGAPSDAKLTLVARATGEHRAFVTAIWWEVLDHASQQKERGSIVGIDPEIIAVKQDLTPETVSRILAGFETRGMTADGAVTNWEKRQYRREDNSTDRVRRFRDRKRAEACNDETQCNAHETVRNDDVTQGNAPDTDTDSEDTPFPPEFDRLWAVFPKRRIGSREKGLKAWEAACKRASQEAIQVGAEAYANSEEVAKGFAKGMAAWLNDDRWASDYARPKPQYTGRRGFCP